MKLKNVVVALAATSIVSAAAFADMPEGLSFSNEISSTIVTIPNDNVTFDGITEEVAAELKSDKVDFKVDAKASLFAQNEDAGKMVAIQDWEVSWYAEYRPINMLTIGFNDGINAAGAYLAVADDNMSGGNFGSNFVNVCLRPIDGLRIGAGVDVVSLDDASLTVPVNFGFDYKIANIGSIGAAVQNVISSGRSFGAYFSTSALENFTFDVGYTFNAGEFKGVEGDHAVNFTCSYGKGDLSAAADFVTDFSRMYAGASASYVFGAFKPSVCATLQTAYAFDDFVIDVTPKCEYSLGKNTFKAGVDIVIEKGNGASFNFPVAWSYAL